MSSVNIRELIAESLVSMEKEGTFLSYTTQSVLDKYNHLDARDKSFYKRVMSGTVERKIRIDYILGLFSSTKINKMKPLIRAVLRSSVYQILWMDNVPDSAVCDEAVKLISKRGLGGLKGFVNGVLRNICRNKDKIEYPDKNKDAVDYYSVVYSCPKWLIEKLICEQGRDICEKILKNTMDEHPISVRLRGTASENEKLINEWISSGVTVNKFDDMEDAYRLRGVDGVKNLPGYDEGLFTVQDYGSMLVSLLAKIQADDVVMDVCAAPGGKSIHAADIISSYGKDAKGCVYSYDLSEEKCDRILENIERLSVKNISVEAHDATVFIPDMEEKADVVIVDAPCSGIGVIGHKSDIKYRLKKEDIASLSEIQKEIISVAVRYVKPGGKLVYSTCTISKEENEMQKEYILRNYPFEAEIVRGGKNDVQLIPGVDPSDGSYIAVFRKEKK